MDDREEDDVEAGAGSRGKIRGMVSSSGYNGTFLLALAALLIIWYFAAHAVDRPFQFPHLESVLRELGYAFADVYVWRNLAITFRRVLLGVFYATLIGFPLGMFMGYSRTAMKTFSPFIAALRQIPMTSWVPLSIVWFGLGDGPSIFVIALIAVFSIILNTVAGVKDISKEYYHAVRSMGATTAGVIKDVVFPGSMSGLITGMRIALGLAWMTVV
jgi:NitT/TauT family transport system permease protein